MTFRAERDLAEAARSAASLPPYSPYSPMFHEEVAR
jgi:hypothetical protein